MNNKVLFNNKYEQVRLLGEGSFGKAFLVESIEDKNLYVIKSINMANMSEDEKKEAIQEGTILEKLDHSNIIKFREVYVDKTNKQTLNIVMDYADGGDLQVRIKAQKGKYFPENQILDWFTQICLAIKHIHDRKILHRDIKSQNIFLTKTGIVKLGDFGIAKCLNFTMDKAKTIVGTPYYLSPEIVHNKPYSFKSDIWSLGVLLYEMCALKMPFDAQNLPLLSLKIIKCSYNPLPPNFSKELRSLVNQMLCIDTNKRPNINEVLKAPIIKSRIKSFLNDKNYDSEFSHTILHKFNILKSNQGSKFDIENLNKDKEGQNQISGVNPSDKNFQKPIIKKDNNTPNNMNKQNIIIKKNYHFEKDKEKEREKDKEIDLLKKNLLNGVVHVNREIFPVNVSKDNNININLNNINQNVNNTNFNKDDKKHNLIINPGYALNYENNRKNKPSLEIENNRTPKINETKIPESNRKLPEKRESSGNYNLNSQYSVNSSNDYVREKKFGKKSSRETNQSIGNFNSKKGNSNDNITTGVNTNASINKESEKETININNSANILDRKRSGSRTSQDEKGDKSNIKDFIKNIRDNVKSGNNNNLEYIVINGKKDPVEREDTGILNQFNQLNIANNVQNLHIYENISNNIPSTRKEKVNSIPLNKEIQGNNGKELNRDKFSNNIIGSNNSSSGNNHTPKVIIHNHSNNEFISNIANQQAFQNNNPNNNNLYNNIYQNLFSNMNIGNNYKDMKDLNEYMETHKMLIELEKVQNEELEEVEYPENNEYRDEFLEEVRKINEEFEIDEDNNIIIQNNQKKNNEFANINSNKINPKENLNYGNIINVQAEDISDKERFLIKEPSENIENFSGEDFIESTIDFLKVENSIRKDLENELGTVLLNKIYDIINKSVHDDIFNFDLNYLYNKIKNTCKSNNIDEGLVDISLNKIPDIYFLILKDREKISCQV